jgi:nucleoside-diphosphate-sugar epimerase
VGELIALAEELSGSTIDLERRPVQPGDAQQTGGAVDRAEEVLGWAPRVPVREGLAHQISWYRRFRAAEPAH